MHNKFISESVLKTKEKSSLCARVRPTTHRSAFSHQRGRIICKWNQVFFSSINYSERLYYFILYLSTKYISTHCANVLSFMHTLILLFLLSQFYNQENFVFLFSFEVFIFKLTLILLLNTTPLCTYKIVPFYCLKNIIIITYDPNAPLIQNNYIFFILWFLGAYQNENTQTRLPYKQEWIK